MKDRIFYYKYYALHKFSTQAMGILKEEMGEIKFHDIVKGEIFNRFTNRMEETIFCHADTGTKTMKAIHLLEDVDQYELTKDYHEALAHICGRKKKAINTNDTTVA